MCTCTTYLHLVCALLDDRPCPKFQTRWCRLAESVVTRAVSSMIWMWVSATMLVDIWSFSNRHRLRLPDVCMLSPPVLRLRSHGHEFNAYEGSSPKHLPLRRKGSLQLARNVGPESIRVGIDIRRSYGLMGFHNMNIYSSLEIRGTLQYPFASIFILVWRILLAGI